MNVTSAMISNAVQTTGLSGHPVCLHASLRSFGWVEGGAQTVIDGLLSEGCTVLVYTLSFAFTSAPPPERRPGQNGIDYAAYLSSYVNSGRVYSPDTQELDRAMVGAIPAAVVAMPERIRGNHPRASFTAVGPLASRLIAGQSALDGFSPLRALARARGFVVLMGVGLDKMTLLHLAEKQAGRNLFRRWANGAEGAPVEVEEGGCSRGFVRLESVLSPSATTCRVGLSNWRVFVAGATLEAAATAIRRDPTITHCGNPDCSDCRDAALGGPILN